MSVLKRTAVTAEAASDRLARVRSLGDLLWRSASDLEVLGRHDEVVAIVAAADLSAV